MPNEKEVNDRVKEKGEKPIKDVIRELIGIEVSKEPRVVITPDVRIVDGKPVGGVAIHVEF